MIDKICICGKTYKRYDDLYFVTNDGVVALIEFDDNDSLKRYFRMNQETSKFGYKRVKIHHNKNALVHRMVFECWGNEPIDPCKVIDHIDSDPSNNKIENLRQVSQKENIMFAKEHGNFGRSNCRKISVYDSVKNTTTEYDSVKDFYRAINAPRYMIKHGSITTIDKRTEYKERYKITKLF